MKSETLYRCLDCGRENFTKPIVHNCGGSIRKGKENLHFESMKNEIVKPQSSLEMEVVSLPSEIEKGIEKTNFYTEAMALCCAQGVAMQVLAGFELLNLSRLLGERRGRPNKSAESALISKTTLDDLLRDGKRLRVSRRTAYIWMKMAKNAHKVIPELQAMKIEKLLPFDLPPEKQKLLLESMSGRVNGMTQLEFWQEAGLVKKPKPTGGYHPRKPKDLQEDSDAQEALDIWKPYIDQLEIWGLEEKTWAHLPRAEMERLHGALIDLSREVGRALKGDQS